MRIFALLATLALFATTMPAHADPGGSDAPDRWQDALDVPPGTHAGVASSADPDWYRVVPGPGQGVRVTFYGGPTQGSLDLRGDDGKPLESAFLHSSGPGASPVGEATAAFPGGVRVGVHITTGPVAYTLEVELVDVADVQVSDVRVRESPFCSSSLSLPCTDARPTLHVDAELRNHGNLPYEGNLTFDAWPEWPHLVGRGRIIGSVSVTLAPGAVVRIGVSWTPVGFGDIELTALASLDANRGNNRASTTYTLHNGDVPGLVVA